MAEVVAAAVRYLIHPRGTAMASAKPLSTVGHRGGPFNWSPVGCGNLCGWYVSRNYICILERSWKG